MPDYDDADLDALAECVRRNSEDWAIGCGASLEDVLLGMIEELRAARRRIADLEIAGHRLRARWSEVLMTINLDECEQRARAVLHYYDPATPIESVSPATVPDEVVVAADVLALVAAHRSLDELATRAIELLGKATWRDDRCVFCDGHGDHSAECEAMALYESARVVMLGRRA